MVLWAIRLDQQTLRVQLVGEQSKRSISLPTDNVFSYRDDLFQKLKDASEAGNSEELANLYKSEKLDINSCNKYQDVLSSIHEKGKEITDSK